VSGVNVWLTAGLGLWRRVVRTRPAGALAIFAVTLAAALLVTGGARLLDRVSTDDLVDAIESAEPRAANIQYVTDGRFGVGSVAEPLSRIRDRGQEIFDDELTTPIQDIIVDQQFVIESPPFRVSSYPDQDEGPFTRTLRIRFQSELDDHLTVVDGRAPGERALRSVLIGDECPPDMSAVDEFLAAAGTDPAPEPLDCRVTDVPVYQVAMTAQTAADLMVDVGDTVVLRPEPTHPRWAFVRAEFLSRVILVEVVGIIELSDPSDDYWFGDDALHRPRIIENPDFRLIFASAVTPPVDYRPMVRDIQDVHFDFAWRYIVDPARIDQTEAADLAAEIDKLGSNEDQVITLLPEIINQHLVERTLTVGLMSTAFAGVLVVSAAATFVLASLAADRQHHSLRLLLDRGIGRGGLRWTGLWHGLVVSVPAVVAALAVVGQWVEQAPWSRPMAAGGLVAVGVVGSVVAAVWLATDRAAKGTVSGPRSVPRSGTIHDLVADESQVAAARRLVRDAALLLTAVGAVVLVRRRAEFGVGAASTVGGDGNRAGGGSLAAVAGSGVDLDLLMAMAPPVIGLAAGVLTIRLLSPLFQLLAGLGGRMRGAVLFVAFRRVVSQGRAARSAVMIVVLAVGMAGFATTTRAAVAEAQRVNGWQIVGADLALRGSTLDAPVPAEAAKEVEAFAASTVAGFQQPLTKLSVPPDLPPTELLAVEASGYRSMLADSPIDPSMLDPLVDAPPEDGVIPAIVSRTWAPARRPSLEDRLELLVGTTRVLVEVVAVVDDFPATPAGGPVVVVDLETLRAVGPPGFAPATVLFVDTAAGTTAGVDFGPGVRVADRLDQQADLAADPFIRWTDIGLRLLTGFAVGLAVLAVVSTLAISAPARKRDLGLLTTMGLGSRQAARVTAVEQVVPILVAAVAGVGVAAGLLRLIVPALNLTAFAGGPLPVEIDLVDSAPAVRALLGPAAVIVGAVSVAVLVSTWWLIGRRRGRIGGADGLTSLSMGEV